ncbi:hypothetical protein [Photorhabdus temperata]|uniref:hypothetical protein n=1 Tax=Photorhabdus temperata TaxID=574560 RepID=UPI00038A0D61|nr:hypothetical protein [Photorhabdus temperata]EQB98717.1 hypothetical protein B738_22770 [Photorhabdus temperata subsp. temperata M1021]
MGCLALLCSETILKTFLFEKDSLENLIFHNHLVRKINTAIDFGFIREAIALRQNQCGFKI